MINDGVSKNRVVVHLPDPLMEFIEAEIARTGHKRSAIIRQAIALRKTQRRRDEAIERDLAANEGSH
ncbi:MULTISPECIES: ribbon-helix-helix domain-containing protein [unclassified Mesorhizobium]|uniref:ribbon-helix-helix domain-containing protein n=1 Tax=unclassified Mesorhizobium TaxID=325217 RepID=UPI00333B0328